MQSQLDYHLAPADPFAWILLRNKLTRQACMPSVWPFADAEDAKNTMIAANAKTHCCHAGTARTAAVSTGPYIHTKRAEVTIKRGMTSGKGHTPLPVNDAKQVLWGSCLGFGRINGCGAHT